MSVSAALPLAFALALASLWQGWAARPLGAVPLPCGSGDGWRLVRERELARLASGGQVIGGFSAARYDPATDQLLLLSDLTDGALLRWGGIAAGRPPRLLEQAPLHSPMDGEAMVALAGQLWVASEGRRTAELPARMLRFEAASGRLTDALPLPAEWLPAPGRGLASNGGPESLVLLPAGGPSGTPALLMGAELPLLQDPPDRVRLLRWHWPAGLDPALDRPIATPAGSLRLPGEGWGLTDLLAVSGERLLALFRRFEPPFGWSIQLALFPLPPAAVTTPAPPIATWDPIAAGLTPDNWEALSPGPPLADGRPSLLLVSDDNLNPLQASRLALLTPIRSAPCPPER